MLAHVLAMQEGLVPVTEAVTYQVGKRCIGIQLNVILYLCIIIIFRIHPILCQEGTNG